MLLGGLFKWSFRWGSIFSWIPGARANLSFLDCVRLERYQYPKRRMWLGIHWPLGPVRLLIFHFRCLSLLQCSHFLTFSLVCRSQMQRRKTWMTGNLKLEVTRYYQLLYDGIDQAKAKDKSEESPIGGANSLVTECLSSPKEKKTCLLFYVFLSLSLLCVCACAHECFHYAFKWTILWM